MDAGRKRAELQRLLERAAEVKVRSSRDPIFKAWKNTVERTLVRIYGQPSPEVTHFHELRFFYNPIMWMGGDDFTQEHRQCFERDWQILVASIKGYIEELPDEPENEETLTTNPTALDAAVVRPPRLFVSHAASDLPIVEELVEILEIVGLTHEQIFCTSLPGYDIKLGENFLDAIRTELLNSQTLVLFVLTRRFFSSPISLCEMGATWVLANDHIPVVVPPFDFADVKGVVPLTQGFRLNDPLKLNLLKEKVERAFGLPSPLGHAAWERKRDRVVERINMKLASQAL